MVVNETPRPQPRYRRGKGRQPLLNRVVLAGLRSPLRGLLDGGTIGLRYPSTGRGEVTLPVMYVKSGQELVVLVGRSQDKTWWRHFLTRRPVDVWWHGAWRPTTAQAFVDDTPECTAAAAAYRLRHPHIRTSRDPVVLVTSPTLPATTRHRSPRGASRDRYRSSTGGTS
jgi:hypothetical protein